MHPETPIPCVKSSILPWESFLSAGVYVALVARSMYAVYDETLEYGTYHLPSLRAGWSFIGRPRDTSDYEWSIITKVMPERYFWWIFGHVILGQVLRYGLFKYRRLLFIIYDWIAITHTLGSSAAAMMLIQTVVVGLVACTVASPRLVWSITGAVLLLVNCRFSRNWMFAIGVLPEGSHYMMADYGLVMSAVRSASCALSICARATDKSNVSSATDDDGKDVVVDDERSSKTDKVHDDKNAFTLDIVMDLLCYVSYLPLLISGPIMTFDDFVCQFRRPLRPWTQNRVTVLAWRICRVVFWAFVFELTIHYFYFGAIFVRPDIMHHKSMWAVVGFGYMMGQFFMVKYYVIYGGFGSVASFDQMSPAGTPICISHVFRYSDIWKFFDRGLYKFMSRHIYFLIGGSKRGVLRQLLGAFLCFAFVYVWHGLTWSIFCWTSLNFVGIVVELSADRFVELPAIQQFEASYLSPAWSRRLKALVAIPLALMSHFAIFTFFADEKVAHMMFHRIFVEGFPLAPLLAIIGYYCFISTSKQLSACLDCRRSKSVDIWDSSKSV